MKRAHWGPFTMSNLILSHLRFSNPIDSVLQTIKEIENLKLDYVRKSIRESFNWLASGGEHWRFYSKKQPSKAQYKKKIVLRSLKNIRTNHPIPVERTLKIIFSLNINFNRNIHLLVIEAIHLSTSNKFLILTMELL